MGYDSQPYSMQATPLHILVLSNCAFDEFQGSGYVIVNTMRCLEKLGHHVEGADAGELFVAKWMKGRANRYRMALGMARYVWANRKKLEQKNLVIFYGAECFAAVWVLKNLLQYRGKTMLHSNGIEMHVDEAMMQGANRVNRYAKFFQWNMHAFFRYAYRHIDCLLTVSAYDRDYALEKMKLPAPKVAMLEPGLHEMYFSGAAPAPEKKPIILYCGGWLGIKGVECIEQALPEVLRANGAYRLRLIGVGDGFNKQAHFPPGILEQVEVIPYVRSRMRLIELFRESEIFIFPSLADSFGLVVAEAMHCGCVAVVSPVGLGYSLVHGQQAWVLAGPYAVSLQQGLFELMNDKNLCEKLSQGGRQRVQGLHWEAYRQQLGRLLAQLMA